VARADWAWNDDWIAWGVLDDDLVGAIDLDHQSASCIGSVEESVVA